MVTMFDFHRSDRGSNPGRGGKISGTYAGDRWFGPCIFFPVTSKFFPTCKIAYK